MTRPVAALALACGLAALAGCGPGDPDQLAAPAFGAGGGSGLLAFLGLAPMGRESLAVLDGAVIVRGPDGYCVDPATSAPDRGFAMLASCARTGGGDAARHDALLTVQLGAAGTAMVSGASADLAALIEGPDGRRLLAVGAPVRVTTVEAARDVVFVEYTETGTASDPAPPPLWRAFLDIGDRLATVSIRPVEGAVLSTDAERRLIAEAVTQLRAANQPA